MNKLNRRLTALEARRGEKHPPFLLIVRRFVDGPDDVKPGVAPEPWRVQGHDGREWTRRTDESEADFIERIERDFQASRVSSASVIVLDPLDIGVL